MIHPLPDKKKDNRGVKLGTKRGKYKKRSDTERENIRFLNRMSNFTKGEFQVKVLELLHMAKEQTNYIEEEITE